MLVIIVLKIYNNLTLLATIPLNISADGLYGQWTVKGILPKVVIILKQN